MHTPVFSVMCTVHCALCTVLCTVHCSVHCAPFCALCTVHCSVHAGILAKQHLLARRLVQTWDLKVVHMPLHWFEESLIFFHFLCLLALDANIFFFGGRNDTFGKSDCLASFLYEWSGGPLSTSSPWKRIPGPAPTFHFVIPVNAVPWTAFSRKSKES